ncbi:DUF6493 family protein [Paractinoplanes lichenicola]|uniref:Secreted protein n=1 Tax=Paractinoplanes lichenicola TaxID=2802976 RepID=A0ABS1VUE6_9ACTN|nr:DUF6493 family protein [Actinoplanes lichenicola]MBL7258104.1 hypothetical protein [Actinoplanes lichenicola]
MTLTWEALSDHIGRAGPDAVAGLLVAAAEPERAALARDLEAFLKSMEPEDWWHSRQDPAGGLGLAVLGTMPTAARAAALLNRRDMREKWGRIPVAHALSVVRARELPWLGDLAGRLVARLRPEDAWQGGWSFAAALLTESGAEVPMTEGFVGGWLLALEQQDSHRRTAFVDRLRETPHLDTLLRAVFEIDGIGAHLGTTVWDMESGVWTGRPAFPAAVAQLVAEGRLDRATILAATIDRLVRSDRPAFLRPFALLHDELAPTLDEQAGHATDYAHLLPAAPSAIAGTAQRALRAVDDAGRLELETLLDVSRSTLVRKEKTLAKAQLTWLDKVARREPGRTGDILETVAAAFDHPALDIQERALTLIEKHARGLDLSWLIDAAAGLGGDLPARAARLSGAPAPVVSPVPASLPPPSPPAALPEPIGSVTELAEEVTALLHEETLVGWERVLAGLVALRGAGDLSPLRHVIDRAGETLSPHGWNERRAALGVAIRGVLRGGPSELRETGRAWRRLVDGLRPPDLTGDPTRLLALRIAEVAERLHQASAVVPVATPTHVNGNLDAAVLVERLRRAEAEEWEPLPLDFEQALLRLPRGTAPAIAEGLTSPAGRRLAEWLAGGGLPDPVSSRVRQPAGRSYSWHVGPPPGIGRVLVTLDPVRTGVLAVEDQVVMLTRRSTMGYDSEVSEPVTLATALPHHREIVAAWALPGLADQEERGDEVVLPLLAENDGPFGPAMSLAVAYSLGARHELDRAAAVDAFLTLAARGTSGFGVAVGGDLGELGALGLVKLNRAVLPLADAHRAGASAAVWEVLAAALPPLLAAAPRGLPDLLELASLVAPAVGAHDEISGLVELAARKGGSRMLKEARRLQAVITA